MDEPSLLTIVPCQTEY